MKSFLTLTMFVIAIIASANEVAVNFIKLNEGFRPTVYYSAGKPHIGYGFTDPVYIRMQRMDEAKATTILRGYVERCKASVRKLVRVDLTENQEAVLIDFIYQFGTGAFLNSTLLKKINMKQYSQVPNELRRWVKQKEVRNGNVVYVTVPGLVNRANRRIQLWNKR